MSWHLKRPPLIAAIMALCGLAVLISLGTWQLQRLAWKTNLIGQVERQSSLSPTELPELNSSGTFEPMQRVRAQGIYKPAASILIGPRVHEDRQGYNLITPMVLDDGGTVLVNRGWVPADYKPEEENPRRTGITGYLHKTGKPNTFTPENLPAKGQWYYINPEQISSAKSLGTIQKLALYAENQENRAAYPIAGATLPPLRNSHFQYACFWFFMAGALTVVFTLRFIAVRG